MKELFLYILECVLTAIAGVDGKAVGKAKEQFIGIGVIFGMIGVLILILFILNKVIGRGRDRTNVPDDSDADK